MSPHGLKSRASPLGRSASLAAMKTQHSDIGKGNGDDKRELEDSDLASPGELPGEPVCRLCAGDRPQLAGCASPISPEADSG
jgi:hypothetical protein